MSNEKILVVDDDEHVRKLIKRALEKENMLFFEADSGTAALKTVAEDSFDLIILDILMNDMDGYEVVKKIRSLGINTTVIFLSGKSEDHDKILGLGIGADDYITKPFSPAVLCAKIKAHLRRSKGLLEAQENMTKLINGPFTLNLKSYKFYKNNIEIPLSSKEIMLMKFFMENPNQVFTKEQLYENIWGDIIIDNNSIMVYIRHLRKKIEDDPNNPVYLRTIWGIGYTFSPE